MRLPGRRSGKPAQRVISLPTEQVAKPCVHVCDDNASVTQRLEMLLGLQGWEVQVTTSGLACLEVVQEHTPDVLVLDQQTPCLSGLEVATAARGAGFDRPILLFSAHLGSDEWRRLEKLGLLPVSKLDLHAVVRHVVASHRQHLTRTRKEAEAPDGSTREEADAS